MKDVCKKTKNPRVKVNTVKAGWKKQGLFQQTMERLTLLAKNFSFFYAIFKERWVRYLTLTDLPLEYKPRLYKLNGLS